MVGSHALAPGDYTIRQLTSAANPRVLEFATNRGTKVVATVTAIPFLQNTPPATTKVIFDNEGLQPRIARILVQGKDYGYEFPKEYNSSQPAVAATVQLQYDDPNRALAAAETARPAETVIAQAQPVPQADRAASPVPPPQPVEIAQNTPRPSPTPQAAPAPVPQPAETSAASIPATALGWMDLVLAGMLFATVGLFLYRRTA